jgi:hypothetical protein
MSWCFNEMLFLNILQAKPNEADRLIGSDNLYFFTPVYALHKQIAQR